jgi:hypothetical protein
LFVWQLGLGISAFVIHPSSNGIQSCQFFRSRIPIISSSNNYQHHPLAGKDSRTRFRPFSSSTSIGGAVADRPAEKEGEETKRRSSGDDTDDGDDDDRYTTPTRSSAWSLSKDGEGFIPNIPLRFLSKGGMTKPGQQYNNNINDNNNNKKSNNVEKQEMPKKKKLLVSSSRVPRVMQINDIHQYKKEVADVTDQIVVVRFYACKFQMHTVTATPLIGTPTKVPLKWTGAIVSNQYHCWHFVLIPPRFLLFRFILLLSSSHSIWWC